MLYRFAGFDLDPRRFELRYQGEVRGVEPQALQLLQYLIERPDELVSREELFREVLGAQYATEDALFKAIQRARKAVGDDGTSQRFIKTVPGYGYRFVATVEVVEPDADLDDSAARHQPSATGKRALWGLGVALTPLVLVGAGWWWARPATDAEPRAEVGSLGVGLEGIVPQKLNELVAVLPKAGEVAEATLRGQELLRQRRGAAALEEFEKAQALEPEYAYARIGAARALLLEGRLHEALSRLTSADDSGRSLPEPLGLEFAAVHAEASGRLAEAQRLYESLSTRRPNQSRATRSMRCGARCCVQTRRAPSMPSASPQHSRSLANWRQWNPNSRCSAVGLAWRHGVSSSRSRIRCVSCRPRQPWRDAFQN